MDDANALIDSAIGAGFIEAKFREYLPNATECLTQANVRRSHYQKDKRVVFEMGNIYGMIMLLLIGLGVATLAAMAELARYKASTLTEDRNRVVVLHHRSFIR